MPSHTLIQYAVAEFDTFPLLSLSSLESFTSLLAYKLEANGDGEREERGGG